MLTKNLRVLILLLSLTFSVVALTSCGDDEPAPGLVAYYDFEDNADDQVGNNDGTAYDVEFVSDGSDKAVSLGGWESYVTLPNQFDYESRTINVSFKAIDVTSELGIIYSCDNDGLQWGQNILSVARVDNEVELYLNVNGLITTVIIEEGIWYTATLVADKLNYRHYLDGDLVGNGTFTGYVRSGNGVTHATVGCLRTLDARFFKGQVDDLRIYNKALTASEIAAL